MLHAPNPVAATERCPVVPDDPADVIFDGPASRELGRDGRGREDPPVGESLADWVALCPGRARKTALTAILGVLGVIGRDPRPQNCL